MVGRLQLQRLLRGIKRVQGTNQTKRLPITSTLLKLILQSLWAACCLVFFGFLRAGEFTINSIFDPDIHITVQDIQVDSRTDPPVSECIPRALRRTPSDRDATSIYVRADIPFARYQQCLPIFTYEAPLLSPCLYI